MHIGCTIIMHNCTEKERQTQRKENVNESWGKKKKTKSKFVLESHLMGSAFRLLIGTLRFQKTLSSHTQDAGYIAIYVTLFHFKASLP